MNPTIRSFLALGALLLALAGTGGCSSSGGGEDGLDVTLLDIQAEAEVEALVEPGQEGLGEPGPEAEPFADAEPGSEIAIEADVGDAAEPPAETTDVAPEEVVDLGEFTFFGDKVVLEFDLAIPAEDWQALLMSDVECPIHCLTKRPYQHATLTFHNPWTGQDEVVDDLGVRYRGKSSACEGYSTRIGLKVSFNAFSPGTTFHGVKKLNFLGTEGDESLLREYAAMRMMRAFGVAAPRVGFATIRVNGEAPRLYPVVQEGDDKLFLEDHFAGQELGHLYKVDGYCGPGTFEYVGDDPTDYIPAYEPNAGTLETDLVTDLPPLFQCFLEADDALFKACFEAHADVERFLRELVADLATPDYDSLVNAAQNFSIYFPHQSLKAQLIPWDKDAAFKADYCDAVNVLDCSPPWSGRPANIARVLALYDAQIKALLVELLAGPMSEAALDQHLQATAARLTPFTLTDPEISPHTMGWYWVNGVEDLLAGIQARRQILNQYLGL
jgi:hypothetical protein